MRIYILNNLQLLEGLGIVSSAEAKKARSHNGNYQLKTSVKVSKSANSTQANLT